MSSLFRLSIVMVLVLATAALGFIAYTASQPKPVEQAPAVEQKAAEPGYYVAARPLPTGTFLRDDDFALVPPGAIPQSPDPRIELRSSVVRRFVDAGHRITGEDILRPSERGFLAAVLAQGKRAISLNVDMESGVSGLIWPGDRVDVVLTQSGKGDRSSQSLSETVLQNVRIIAIDQETVEGVPAANAAAGKIAEGVIGANPEPRKVARSVSLELSPEQVKKITLAKDLGKLALAVRSADEVSDAADSGTPLAVRPANAEDAVDSGATFGRDVSPEIARQEDDEIARHDAEVARKAAEVACQKAMARQFTTVVVYAKGKHSEYTVRKQGMTDAGLASGCAGYAEMAPTSASLADANGEKAKE